ncbi:STAS-like domain-containing protein, partial [Enterococcus casseliflavus]|uniref:STAS-like domain-containing protein n=1 Tax=Enterococcus casseliflavus TaxID=37734 RepID=UPI003DA1D093
NDDGDKLFNIIVDNFENDNPIQVSFKGIDSLNSSFVNSAFIMLLDIYTFNEIREKLSFVDTNKQINLLILGRFKFEVKKKAEIKEMVLA